MPTFRMTAAYDGSAFRGWAAQPGERTIEAELAAALERVLGTRVDLTVAGRTDAGVHAWQQVVSFDLEADPPERVARALNALTSPEIVVLDVGPAADGFDARRDARSRTYCYRILAEPTPDPFEHERALWWPHRIDRESLDACAQLLRRTHDFTAFTPTVNVEETDDEFKLTAELPGLDDEDFEVSIDGHLLTIKGEKKYQREADQQGANLAERSHGSFQRSFRLAWEIDPDTAKASYQRGCSRW